MRAPSRPSDLLICFYPFAVFRKNGRAQKGMIGLNGENNTFMFIPGPCQTVKLVVWIGTEGFPFILHKNRGFKSQTSNPNHLFRGYQKLRKELPIDSLRAINRFLPPGAASPARHGRTHLESGKLETPGNVHLCWMTFLFHFIADHFEYGL